jgi:hypothetical protein
VYRQDRPDHPPAYLRTAVVNGCHNWHRSTRLGAPLGEAGFQ